MLSVLSLDIKQARFNLHSKVSRVVVAALLGSLLVPVGSIGTTALLDQANANYPITCSISGSFTSSGSEIMQNSGKNCKGIVTVPEGIQTIGSFAFNDGENANAFITQILLPSTIRTIGSAAFQGLINLTSLTIPGLTNVQPRPFINTGSITELIVNGGTDATPTKLDYTSDYGVNSGRTSNFLPQRLVLGPGRVHIRQDGFETNGPTEIIFGSGTYYIGTNNFITASIQAVDFGTSTSPQIVLAKKDVTNGSSNPPNPFGFSENKTNPFQGSGIRSIRNCDSNPNSAFNMRLKEIKNNNNTFLYNLSTCNNTPPTITNTNPPSSPGGSPPTSIAITGTDFVGLVGVRGVMFGNTPAASYTVNSATSITAVPPSSVTSGTYSVTVNTFAGSATYTPSNVSTLSNLVLSSGTLSPGFNSGTTSYTTSVASSTSSITVTPSRTQANATITVNGSAVTSGNASGAIPLNFGSNDITVLVRAQDGVTTSTYTVAVTRPSNISTLSNLVLSTGTLSPGFNSGTTSYTTSVANSVATGYAVTPTRTNSNSATVQYLGSTGTTTFTGALAVGANVIRTIVTAQDGVTTTTYTVTVTRAASNVATLSAASIKGQTSTLGNPNAVLASVTAGTITLTTAQATGVDTTTFTKTDATATTKIVKYASGSSTSNFETDSAFTDGSANTVANNDFFIVKVTAADASVRYYRINVIVNSNISTLSGMSVKGQTSTLGTPNAALGSETPGAITLTTSQATGIVATTFSKTDAGSTTKIVKYSSGITADTTNFGAAVDLTSGTTTTVSNSDYFIIRVTAADGSTVNYYRINVTVNSDVATLSGASIKGQTATLGTPNAVLVSVGAGAITLTTAQATGTDATTFTKTDAGATVSRIVKYASGSSTSNFETDAAFTNGATDTVTNSDFFIVKVIAADATVRFYRIDVTVNSNVATLSGASIKGQTATLGTPNATLGSETAGAITLTTAQAIGTDTTTFTKTDAGANISRIVKYASGASTSNFETDSPFTNSATITVSNNDFFIIKVTAADGTVRFYRVNVTVNSDIATLSGATIKGQTPTLGTPNAVLASAGAGAITLTTAQATGTDATTFTKTDAGANISRIVKYGSGASTANFETDSAFTDGSATTVANDDFFIIKVTAADGTIRFYRVNVIVNSNVSTLSGATIKGQNATLGTPNSTLGSETAGAITLTTAQATSTSLTSTVAKTNAGATAKIVKYASGVTVDIANFDAGTDLTSGTTTTVASGDYFIVKVAAQDGSTVSYYRIDVTVNSDVATLSGASVKGQTATLGTPNAVLTSAVAGVITLTTAQATGTAETTFTKTDAGATITKIVKYGLSASTSNFESDAAFTNSATTAVSNGDFFIIKVTAADATVSFYRVTVTVNSNVATLSAASIKGVSATVGTAGSALGSLSAGTVNLTLSQRTGTAVTTFTQTDVGATITKIAKIASGTVENSTNFNAAAAFTNSSADTVSTGDYFIIQVTAADGTVNFTRVNLVSATNPTVPLNLIATSRDGGANLTWNAPASNGGSALTGYVIEASTDSATWAEVGTTNESTRQFSVTNLLNGTAYTYRVKANNSSGDSNFNWATSSAVRSSYYITCSSAGSFYVSSTASPVQIPAYAGKDCVGEVTIPVGIKMINRNAFTSGTDTYNRSVTKVTLPVSGLQTIDQSAFRRLGLTTVTIPATVEVVGNYSFDDNFITTAVVLGTTDGFPATGNNYHATSLGQAAFRNNGKNSDGSNNAGLALTLGSGKIEIAQLFGQDTVFSSVDWGTGLRGIGNRAFYNVAASSWAPLFPATITSFSTDAFFGTGIKTIRFGTATTHPLNLTIATSAFDPSITSVQYCGETGKTLSNYINSRFTSKTIWCAEVVPNAPTSVTAVPGASGQIVLSWSKGASLNEAPTDGFDIRYSSDGGSTWSTLIQAAASATSITIPNLTNSTSYVFQIRAKNLFGNSNYSANATGIPLGTQVNPTFGPSTSTADGFTVNVTNYDASYTYGVPQFTVGSGSIAVGTATGTNLPITVTGMTPGSVATFSIGNQKSGFTSGSGLASGSALNAAKVPEIGSIVRLTGGFTAAVTNYDSAYQWNVSATVGTAVINSQGAITVTGVAPSTSSDLTVSTTRTGYAPGSTMSTITTRALLQVIYDGTRSTGGAVPTDANSYASNSSAIVLANPASGGLTLSGYDFAGWTLNSNETGQVYQSGSSLALVLVNVTLYAKWTLTQYTVTYNANGATGGAVPLNSNTYTMGGSVPISGNTGTLVRTGYSFIGWGISSTDTVNLYVSGNTFTVGTNNIAFWARWSANTYRVTFDANGGSGAPSKAYDDYTTAGTAITLATVGTMQKTGYNFTGWGLSAVSTPVADPFTTAATIDLYAQWTIASYAVTYLAGTYGSGTVPTQANVNYGSSFTAAASTGLTGNDGTYPYAFVSWSDGTRTYAPGQSILMGAGAVTLTAQWTRIYNVKYSFNGGSVGSPIADQQKIAGDTIVVSSTVPTRAGYDFVTWKDQSGEEATAGANYVVRDSHYLLYAQWVAKSYTITYDVNGGNTSPTQANRTIGQIFSVAAAPSKIGHDFEYWSDGTNNYNAGSDYQVGTANVVLQAIWTPKVYQISYNFNGGTGTPISAQNYTFGTGPANLPASGPTRSEYNFTGWANSTTATTGVFTYEPSGNILLHAVWVTSVYRLTFNAGVGVSDTATATVTISQSLTLPSATRTNYTLQGWSTSPTGGNEILAGSSYTPPADGTLYAQWAPQIFTVTYNGNGGTAGKASDSVVFNAQTPIPLPSASRANYVFSGWYSQASGGFLLGESGANYSPTASITAYARWVQGSLNGMGPATLIAQITVRDGIDSGFNAGSNGSTATVAYTAGALPDGTVITAYLENSATRVTSLLQTPASPLLSLIIAWVAPDGTVPDTAAGKPILLTIINSSITAGSKIFGLVGNQPELLGIALVNGQVQVSISKDPAVIVAMVAPDAPTTVTATAVDSSSATISWVAPASNGGSAITKYTATAGAGNSCESTTTSCVISGLAAGTPYTFTVLATNAIGNSAASSPSAQLSLTAPPSSGGGGGGGGGGAAPAPVVTTPVVPAPEIETKAAAEKAAADAKAAAEAKAVQEKAAAEAAATAALKAAQEIADAQAKAAAELKAAQDKAEEDLRIATELKAAQEKADAELKAAAEKKAVDDAAAAAALAAKKIVPKITLYSITSKLTLSAYDNAYLKKYISTLKTRATVTCIGYYYTKNTTLAKAKALATTQAKAVCTMIKKAKPSAITKIAIYPATKAPRAAKGAKWVAVSYRVDSFKGSR